MEIRVTPAALSGTVAAIPSKSHLHRLLICAALADAPTRIIAAASSRDIEATVGCLNALGATIRREGDTLLVSPIGETPDCPLLDCGESGSTLRFLLPVAAALCSKARFSGSGRLPERPIGHLLEELRRHGVNFSAERLPFTVSGRLTGGDYHLPGHVSSQYLTGLLLALPTCAADSRLRLTTALESSAYIDITLTALQRFCVRIDVQNGAYLIPGRQAFRSPGRIAAEGDWSNAAFFLAAGALAREVAVSGLDPASPQGDRRIVEILKNLGAKVSVCGHSVAVGPAELRGAVIDISPVPDLLPALAVLVAFASGETRFINGARLRLKESDRLAATAGLIRALGGSAEERGEELIVQGQGLQGGVAESCNDHRIVMAAALAAVGCVRPVIIRGAEAVAKSYPHFFDDYRSLGGIADVL